MEKSIRERNALMVNHLIQERQKIEDLSMTRIDRDYKKLYDYITQWWGTPYRIGGSSLDGIDCSGFVKGLFSDTYSIQLPRTSREQANFSQEISKESLQEGDLVFFHQRKGISHVGMYLSNNKFVHASTSMGVIISDLNEPYWNKRFVKAGRIINHP